MWEYINHVIDCDGINVQINKCLGSTSRQRGWQKLRSTWFLAYVTLNSRNKFILRQFLQIALGQYKTCEILFRTGPGRGPATSKSRLLRLCTQERILGQCKLVHQLEPARLLHSGFWFSWCLKLRISCDTTKSPWETEQGGSGQGGNQWGSCSHWK